jgi:cholesterol transport system auxiliary component
MPVFRKNIAKTKESRVDCDATESQSTLEQCAKKWMPVFRENIAKTKESRVDCWSISSKSRRLFGWEYAVDAINQNPFGEWKFEEQALAPTGIEQGTGVRRMGISARRKASRPVSGLASGSALLLLSGLLLAGCATPQVYGLRPAASAARMSRANISVDVPTAAPPLDNDLVVVRESADSFARLPGARWADRLTYLVQSRTVETFQNAGLSPRLRGAGEPSAYSLALAIRRFDIDATNRVAQVEIVAQVVTAGGRVVATKIFSACEPVGAIAAPDAVQALDQAFGQILSPLVAWAAKAG